MTADPLHYPFATPPSPGELRAVAPGVYWLRMPLPFALDHINLWLLEDGDGWTLVDTGIGSDAVKELWETLLAGPLAGRPIKRIIVTHFHPDHLGLAGWLGRRFQAPLLATKLEYEQAVWLRNASGARRAEGQRRFFSAHGLAADAVEELASGDNVYRARVSELPTDYQRVSDGESLTIGGRRWQVIVGRGHSPEHLCLYCPELELFIAGDQVLPKISPNISVSFLNPEANPLAEYLTSLTALKALPAAVRVLPAHGLVFQGLHPRLDELLAHHQERLDLLLNACEAPKSGAEALSVLFDRHFGPHELFFAMGESVAHLHHLHGDGLVRVEADPEGVLRFLRTA